MASEPAVVPAAPKPAAAKKLPKPAPKPAAVTPAPAPALPRVVKKTAPIELFADAAPTSLLQPQDLDISDELLPAGFDWAYGALTADNKILYVGKNGYHPNHNALNVQAIEIDSQTSKSEWPAKGGAIELLSLSADGSTLATAFEYDEFKNPCVIKIQDARTGAEKCRCAHLPNKDSNFNHFESIALSPDGKTAVSITNYSHEGTHVYICWSAETGKRQWHLATSVFSSNIRFTRDGKHVLFWCEPGPAIVDVQTGEIKEHFLTISPHSDAWVEFNKQETEILVSTRKRVKGEPDEFYFIRIDRATGKRISSLRLGTTGLARLQLLADGEHLGLLYNRDSNGELQIRRIETGELRACFRVKWRITDGILMPAGDQLLLGNRMYLLSGWR